MRHSDLQLVAPAGFEHLAPGVCIHTVHEHQGVHARFGHGRRLPDGLRPHSHAAAQHLRGVAVAQIACVLRQHHMAKSHLQFVFNRGIGAVAGAF